MKVWYSSCNNDILSDYAHKKYFDAIVDIWQTDEKFKSFLEEKYSLIELFNFTDADRDKAKEDFGFWAYEKANCRDTYKPYMVQFMKDEEEK